MKFDPVEIPRLIADPSVAAFSRAAVESLFAGSVQPLMVALDAAPLQAAAFASSMQGLSCRLALLPDLGTLPEPLVVHILSEAELTAARGRKIVERLRDVLEILESAGVEAVPLKGAARILRGDVEASLRPMGDLDLLLADRSRVMLAAEALERRTPYRRIFSTPRHLVLAETGEAVASPGAEDPDNPLRIELHRSFRLPVLGVALDASDQLRGDAEMSSDGVLLLPDAVLLRHLWHHAAEDFAARGIRGIQAVDFLDMARRHGALRAALHRDDARGAAPLLYAADAIERLFPGTFDCASVDELSRKVRPALRERASRLSVLRHSRPGRGWSKISLSLAPGVVPKARFLIRTAFPTPGEVKANIAPGASGFALAATWIRVLARRATSLFR